MLINNESITTSDNNSKRTTHIPFSSSEMLWFIFNGQRLLLTDKMEIPKGNPFIQSGIVKRCIPFIHAGTSYITAELEPPIAESSLKGMQWRDLLELYLHLPKEIIAPAGKARQLIEWDKSFQYCGECGSSTSNATDEHSRICMNTTCQRVFYPKISPVIMVAIERGQEILLAQSPNFPPDIYSVIAGFVEPGENIEQAVKRGVLEETGIEIDNLRYFASQSWPRPNELLLGFQANYKSGIVTPNPDEIEKAAFFHFDSLPKTFPGNATISQWLLKDFCKRHRRKSEIQVPSQKK